MNPIPSPVAADGMVFVTSGFRGNSLRAIDLAAAKGEISGAPGLAWSVDRDTPYVPSPLLHDGIIYILKTNSGVLSAFDARTGKPHYQVQRLDGVPNVFSSPVVAADRIYIVGREGTTAVVKPGPAYALKDQHARRPLRRVAGAGGEGDVSQGRQISLLPRALIATRQHRYSLVSVQPAGPGPGAVAEQASALHAG